jgi:hypothetical protein
VANHQQDSPWVMKQSKNKNHKIPHIYDNISVIPVKFDLVGGFNHLEKY